MWLFANTPQPTTLHDAEFGDIALRWSPKASRVSLRVQQGKVRITLPLGTPDAFAKQLLEQSRPQIRRALQRAPAKQLPSHGDIIGRSHRLELVPHSGRVIKTYVRGTSAKVLHPRYATPDMLQQHIADVERKALRHQAKALLPSWADQLANQHGVRYKQLRFSDASTRWGSCSALGTISLNIRLLYLPDHLVEYVIVHELCHTLELNHSPAFWRAVEQRMPDYAARRRELRGWQP